MTRVYTVRHRYPLHPLFLSWGPPPRPCTIKVNGVIRSLPNVTVPPVYFSYVLKNYYPSVFLHFGVFCLTTIIKFYMNKQKKNVTLFLFYLKHTIKTTTFHLQDGSKLTHKKIPLLLQYHDLDCLFSSNFTTFKIVRRIFITPPFLMVNTICFYSDIYTKCND